MAVPKELFRSEAVQFHQQYRTLGNVAALQPLSVTLTAWLLVLSTAAVVGFLFVGQYTRKETAVGYLTPSIGTAKVFVPRRGVIKTIHVNEGEMVREGQVLLTVDTDQIAVGGADVNTTMLDSLSAQKRLLEDTIAAEERRAGSEKERLTVFARGLETEISELAKQSVLQAERLKVAESELAVGQQLQTKGYATAVDL